MKTIILTFSIANSSVTDYFLQLCNKFVKDFRVVVITDRIEPHPFFVNPEIIIYKWPSLRPTTFYDFLFAFKILRRHRPELTISLFGSVNVIITVGFILRVASRQVWIRTLSSQFPQLPYKVVRKSIIYRMATNIIANSEATKLDSITLFNLTAEKVKVIPNAVGDYFDKYLPFNKSRSKIVYAGRLHSSKGVDVLLNAFNLLSPRYPELTLDIYGAGSMHQKLKEIPNTAAQAKVSFKGSVSKDKVLTAFAESVCVVIPSNTEAFGFTVIEAMSMKTCTIGANNTGIKEIIIDGESGMLFNTGDSDDLAKKIDIILLDEKLCNQLAAEGYRRFKENYDIGNAIDKAYEHFKGQICKS